MQDRVHKPTTPEGCEQLAINAADRGNATLARAARRWAIERRAESHGATDVVEREALEAVYAYEKVLTIKRGRKVRASGTWLMIKKAGLLAAIEQVVARADDTMAYPTLAEMGLQEMAFESVVVRHRESFSPVAVARSEERLKIWNAAKAEVAPQPD